MNTETLQNLRAYLKGKTPQELRAEMEEIRKMNLGGPDVATYLSFLNETSYQFVRSDQVTTEFEFTPHTTPDFSGSFFLCNIVA